MDIPKFYPLVGNKYLQQAVMDFNDAATYASNIGKQPKDVTLPPATYNPYINMYYGEYGGSLPTASGGMFINTQQPPAGFTWGQPYSQQGTPVLDQTNQNTVQLPSQDSYNIDLGQVGPGSTSQGSNPWVTAGAIAGTVAKIGSGITKGIKGGLDIAGSTLANRAALTS
jgi:hypothetical protein